MEILIIKNHHTIVNWESKTQYTKYQECDIEKLSSQLTKNKKIKKFVITLLGCTLYFKNVFASTKGIDSLGWTLLGLIRHWAYWILLIWCIVDVVKSGLSGDSKKTLPIVLKYVIIFASMYLIPVIFDAVKGAF
ncbi:MULTISPECIES: hypothetical protein [Clostridium]|uniref:Uncharacterized protein n=1 Tax=Clostridium frigoriphilum TaxID=443253 RepID=A0ABU7UHP3_9CLOT|nr:hypothetical protein [Clostridium sp. DSM 17811]MBU3098404.1 hypothetical protein [Clostridium sp. DSM 17811]